MKIESLKVMGIGGIKELDLSFQESFNVICGANGVGKTTILEIIADAFTSPNSNLKRNANFEQGEYTISFQDVEGISSQKTITIKEFMPTEQAGGKYSTNESQYVLFFSINRMLEYRPLNSIPKDSKRENYESAEQLHCGVDNKDLKGWFVNRFVFYDKTYSLNEEQKHNFELAIRALSLLDSTVSFLTVDASTLDIILKTDRGNIFLEYFSSGYKSCFFLLLGIIKEIELRFKTPSIKAEDFNGVILIDEIDLHLHPTWQGVLISALKESFPKAQFIVTTHSPNVLQTLKEKEIIALCVDENGGTIQKEFVLGQHGLQGWTIEEILKDIMGLETTTSATYECAIKMFDDAMEREDIRAVQESYAVLKEMLHPNNILLKMMDIQTAGME